MTLARFLVCEKTGRWAVALRREMANAPLPLHATRGLAACRAELERSPASFVAMELSRENAAALTEWIDRAAREFPQARIAVFGARPAREFEWFAREAGAIFVTFSPRRLAPLVRLARRHLAAAPEEPLTWRERLARRLPWKPRTPESGARNQPPTDDPWRIP